MVWIAVPDQDLTPEPFLPGEAEELMATGNFNQDVEVIIGTNSDEGLLNIINVLVDPTQWDEYRDNFDTETIPIMFNIPNQSDITEDDIEKAHELVEFYVGSMVNINEDHKQGIFDLGTDSWFLYGTYKTIKYLLQYGVTVYQYVLTYRGKFSWSQLYGLDPPQGVCHADDLIYLWNPVSSGDKDEIPIGPLDASDSLVRELMTSTWVNFAIYGDPTPPNSGLSWTPVQSGLEHQFWNISGHKPTMASSQYIRERMEKWRNVLGD